MKRLPIFFVMSFLSLVLSSCGTNVVDSEFAAVNSSWNTLLISGDNQIEAFDNAVSKMGEILTSRGNITAPKKMLARSGDKYTKATVTSIPYQLYQNSEDTNKCFIFMTSHGAKNQGFYLHTQYVQFFTPQNMTNMLNQYCKDKPTILLISSCYSGFFSDTQSLRKDNIAILTAAASDRTSFGCGVENKYTYWDSCLVDNYNRSKTINELSANILQCIKNKEKNSSSAFSNPQTFIGSKMQNFVLP